MTRFERKHGRYAKPLTRPEVVGASLDKEEMLELAKRCRYTERHGMVRTVTRSVRAEGLRFDVHFVFVWPKDLKVEVQET